MIYIAAFLLLFGVGCCLIVSGPRTTKHHLRHPRVRKESRQRTWCIRCGTGNPGKPVIQVEGTEDERLLAFCGFAYSAVSRGIVVNAWEYLRRSVPARKELKDFPKQLGPGSSRAQTNALTTRRSVFCEQAITSCVTTSRRKGKVVTSMSVIMRASEMALPITAP